MNAAARSPFSPRSPLPERLAAALGGNRCGHLPRAPRFHLLQLPEAANQARPAPILKAVARLREYYTSPRESRWDALSQTERWCRHARQRSMAGDDPAPAPDLPFDRNRWRQQRSERREAVVLVLSLMVYYTDISSLIVAVPHGPDRLGLSAPWVASHTGLSLSRVKRALTTLSRSSWLANTGRGRHFDPRRRRFVGAGWGPVRRLSFRLIRALGVDVSWRQAQRKARKPDARRAVSGSPDVQPDAGRSRAPVSAALPRPAPTPETVLESQRTHARTLRQALASPAARQAQTDPTAHQTAIARNRRMAELAAQGLSPAEIRRRLDDGPQPP